jgi:trk system potassium uptake protein TrkH
MWRSFANWIGGMGVLVFIMAFLPLGGAQNLHIMRAESPGPTVSKLVPKMRTTALILYLIYFIFTVIMFIALLFDSGADAEHGKMNVFQALNTAFATAGTGGFGFMNDSFAGFSNYVQIVVTVFMLLFSINFSSYYLVIKKRFRDALNLEVRVFLIIVATAIVLIACNIHYAEIGNGVFDVANTDYTAEGGYSWGDAFKHAAFNVATVISTSGFGTENFVAWPQLSQVILVLLMFIGACAGSTGGGIKVSRIIILVKGVGRELKAAIRPRQVKKLTIDNRPVEAETVRSVNAYIVCYIAVFIGVLLLISLDPYVEDLTTAFTAVTATINNIGPGLGTIGPTSNFTGFNSFSTIVLTFSMIAGRLELLPMLLLFAPSTWKNK